MSWVSPVVGGITGLAQGLIGYFGQKSANEAMLEATQQTNDQNYKIWQEQQEHNVDMFNMQNQANIDNWWTQFNATNAYNTASAQRQRLEEAGLNPYLMMNGGSAGTASSSAIPSASATPAQAPTMQTAPPQAFTPAGVVAAQQAISGMLGMVQSLNIGVDSSLKTAQANEIDESLPFKLSSLSAHADMDNMTSKFMKEFGYDTAKYNLENLKFETFLNKSRYDYQELENQLKRDTMQDVVANVHAQRLLSELNVEQAQIINKYLDANQQLQLAKLAEECAVFKSQTSLNEKQADYIVAQKFKVWAETQGIKIQNEINEATKSSQINIINSQGVDAKSYVDAALDDSIFTALVNIAKNDISSDYLESVERLGWSLDSNNIRGKLDRSTGKFSRRSSGNNYGFGIGLGGSFGSGSKGGSPGSFFGGFFDYSSGGNEFYHFEETY